MPGPQVTVLRTLAVDDKAGPVDKKPNTVAVANAFDALQAEEDTAAAAAAAAAQPK